MPKTRRSKEKKRGFWMTTLVDDEEILSKIMKYNTRWKENLQRS